MMAGITVTAAVDSVVTAWAIAEASVEITANLVVIVVTVAVVGGLVVPHIWILGWVIALLSGMTFLSAVRACGN